MDMATEKHNLLWGIQRSIRYHARRVGFFETAHNTSTALQLLAGSAAMAAFLQSEKPEWGVWTAVAVTAIAAVNLVWGTAKKARIHSDLIRRWIYLEHDLTTNSPTRETDLKKYQAARLEIEAEEPPPLRTLDMLCHNELALATGQFDDLYAVHWWQRPLVNFFDIRDEQIQKAKRKMQ